MFVDYYAILEIDINSNQEEIKASYRKQCIKWHPDKNPNSDTTQRMQDINQAYLILKDDDAKKRYDQEYLRFKASQDQSFKESTTEFSTANSKQEQKQESSSDKESTYTYSNYKVSDEILEKWMSNAKNQAKKMAEEAIDEFRGATLEAGNSIIKNLLYFILPMLIGYILVKACISNI